MTWQYVANTGNTQAMTTAALEDEVRGLLVKLEKVYVEWQKAPSNAKPKLEMESPAAEFSAPGPRSRSSRKSRRAKCRR